MVASEVAINDNNVRLPIRNNTDLNALQSLWSWTAVIVQLRTPGPCKVDVGVEHESTKPCYCRMILSLLPRYTFSRNFTSMSS